MIDINQYVLSLRFNCIFKLFIITNPVGNRLKIDALMRMSFSAFCVLM